MLPYIQSLQEAADIYHFSAYWIRTPESYQTELTDLQESPAQVPI